MKPFHIQKILIPVDLSENSLLALEHGVFMSKLLKADIEIAHVVENNHWFVQGAQAPSPETDKKLKELIEDIHLKSGVTVHLHVKPGKISKTIVDIAKQINADLIVMGTHGVSGFEEFFAGSNAFRVVTDAPCPVLTVQTHATKMGFSDILLPIDNTPSSREKVRYAVALAQHYGSKIHLLGILSVEDNSLVGKFNIMFDQIEEYIKQHDLKFSSELVYGDNMAVLTMKYGKKIGADLVVIMTEQEENFTGFLLGPYAQQVVNHSKIPVMSIRPSVE
jgi:nucleotide-binding universal stress UspA family protein